MSHGCPTSFLQLEWTVLGAQYADWRSPSYSEHSALLSHACSQKDVHIRHARLHRGGLCLSRRSSSITLLSLGMPPVLPLLAFHDSTSACCHGNPHRREKAAGTGPLGHNWALGSLQEHSYRLSESGFRCQLRCLVSHCRYINCIRCRA